MNDAAEIVAPDLSRSNTLGWTARTTGTNLTMQSGQWARAIGQPVRPGRYGRREWSPHSFLLSSSHHQRPARSDSPGVIARVHGAQPMDAKPCA